MHIRFFNIFRRHIHWKVRAHTYKDLKEIFFAEVISVTFGLVAGIFLAVFYKQFLLVPGILILLPGFLELRGNISGSLSARLGTALDIKAIKPKLKQKFVVENYFASFFEAIAISFALSLVAYVFTFLVFHQATLKIFAIAILAALLSNLVESTLAIITTFWLYKKGHDPNNIMGPYVTTTGDIVSMLSLIVAILIVV
jgi:mgtE-like transporter